MSGEKLRSIDRFTPHRELDSSQFFDLEVGKNNLDLYKGDLIFIPVSGKPISLPYRYFVVETTPISNSGEIPVSFMEGGVLYSGLNLPVESHYVACHFIGLKKPFRRALGEIIFTK